MKVVAVVIFSLTSQARYLRDHRLIASLALGGMSFTHAGSMVWYGLFRRHNAPDVFCPSILIIGSFAMAVVAYTFRHKRRLPRPLRRCRFVRLGFLRQAVRSGLRIQRGQDMPPEAFGDVEKAAVLLVVSHRWLDRFNCDVPSEACPTGLRLATMTQRLNEIFPDTFLCSTWRSTLRSMRYGGNDVLVFFDFMSLPQVGLDPKSGQIIERTPSQAQVFFEALPHMGALYTMYPVLVLNEVTPGVAPYESSGWCFTEFCSAMLTKQLGECSAAALESYARSDAFACLRFSPAADTIDERREEDFIKVFDKDLSAKSFLDDHDRQIARRIVLGSLVIRRLTDAVRQGSQDDTRALLARLRDNDLLHVLNHAVDGSMDTLLHLAVREGHRDVARLLMEAGSSPLVRNYRGDRPHQCFLLRRCSPAAALCRQESRSLRAAGSKDEPFSA